MKKMAMAAFLAALIGAMAVAAPGPFIRVEQTWDTGLVLQAGLANLLLKEPVGSINTGVLDLYVGKSDPMTITGWWTLGAGGWIITDYAPNANFGGGLRFLIKIEDSTIPSTAWCPYLELGWWFGPFQVFGRLNWFYEFSQNKPLGGPSLSFGATIDLWRLGGGK